MHELQSITMHPAPCLNHEWLQPRPILTSFARLCISTCSSGYRARMMRPRHVTRRRTGHSHVNDKFRTIREQFDVTNKINKCTKARFRPVTCENLKCTFRKAALTLGNSRAEARVCEPRPFETGGTRDQPGIARNGTEFLCNRHQHFLVYRTPHRDGWVGAYLLTKVMVDEATFLTDQAREKLLKN